MLQMAILGLATNPASTGDATPLRKGLGWRPLCRLSSAIETLYLGIELINLLKRQSLCFIDEKVDKGDADETAAKPDKENLRLQVGIAVTVVHKVGSRVGNSPIE